MKINRSIFLFRSVLLDFQFLIDAIYARYIFVFVMYNCIYFFYIYCIFIYILSLIFHLLHFYSEASFYEFRCCKSQFLTQQIFIRHDNERKFNYIQLCINVCHFFLLSFCWILRDDRAVTTSSLPFERYLARGKDWVESWRAPISLIPPFSHHSPGRCPWSRKLFELRTVFKDTFLPPLRTLERMETRSGNSNRSSKSSSRAKLYIVRKQEARFFFRL